MPGSVLLGHRELDVDRSEEREDVGLQHRDEDLEEGEGESEGEASFGRETSPSARPAASTDHQPPRPNRKNCVAAKNSTSRRCPTIMFIRSRRVSVTGRMRNVEMNSIGVTMKYTGHGTPAGNSEFLMKFFGLFFNPA